MDSADPALFYTGLVAQMYGPLRSTGAPDPAPYARYIERSGEPALELGCGSGDPLLDLRSLGYDIEGLDSSPDMLERCRDVARSRGLSVVVHLQQMQSMQLDRQFRSIFLAGPTFNLLPDDDVARRSLTQIRMHLAPGGAALVPLFIPEPTPVNAFGRARLHSAADGTEMRLTPVSEQRDESARCQTTVLRYEATSATGMIVEERPWLLHWYGQDDIRSIVADAGLAVTKMLSPTGGPAGDDDKEFIVLLHDPERRT